MLGFGKDVTVRVGEGGGSPRGFRGFRRGFHRDSRGFRTGFRGFRPGAIPKSAIIYSMEACKVSDQVTLL